MLCLLCPALDDPQPYLAALRSAGVEEVALFSRDGLPADALALFAAGADAHSFEPAAVEAVRQTISRGVPVLACGPGMQALNLALGGSMPDFVSGHAAGVKREIFLSPGGKVSHSIGGSGWVNVPCAHSRGLKAGDIAPGLLASAYARDGVIEAIEQPGRRFVIGVQWPLHSLSELPRGFDNLLMAFADQTSAGPQPAR